MFLYSNFNSGYSRYSLFNLISKRFSLSRFSHPFHLVDPSVWPLIVATAVFYLALGGVKAFQGLTCTLFDFIFELGLLLLMGGMFLWLHDVMVEATFEGRHTLPVRNGLKWGFLLFIVSEVFFFAAFFWGFFHMSLAPSIELGAVWPPVGIKTLNPFGVPLVNTLILLLSGVWVTSAHAFFAAPRYFEPKESITLRKYSANPLFESEDWYVFDKFASQEVDETSNIEFLAGAKEVSVATRISSSLSSVYKDTIVKILLTLRILIARVFLRGVGSAYSTTQLVQWSYFDKFTNYGKLGRRVGYWCSDLDVFGTSAKPIITNNQRYLNDDVFDRSSTATDDFEENSVADELSYVIPKLQTKVRISWLRNTVRKFFITNPKGNVDQLGLNEFSTVFNSSVGIQVRFLQYKYSFSRLSNAVKLAPVWQAGQVQRLLSKKTPELFMYRWTPSTEDAAYRIRVAALLGLIFLVLQYGEYSETSFDITDSVYGSLFFVATGFHGFHVFVGMVMLAIASARASAGHFFSSSALGFEAAAWYWHFVDVVWLFLYIFVYHWGS